MLTTNEWTRLQNLNNKYYTQLALDTGCSCGSFCCCCCSCCCVTDRGTQKFITQKRSHWQWSSFVRSFTFLTLKRFLNLGNGMARLYTNLVVAVFTVAADLLLDVLSAHWSRPSVRAFERFDRKRDFSIALEASRTTIPSYKSLQIS